MRLANIDLFVCAADQQNFAEAARIIGISPSAVGKAVARLEEHLGARLFSRTTRSVRLTEEGQIFYEHCKRMIEEFEETEASIFQNRQRPKGRLHVTVPHIVGHHLLMPILPEFVAKYPEIRLDIDFDDHVVDLVGEGFDIAVRSGDLADTRLIARPLGEQHFTVCASPGYLETRGEPETPLDLASHDCIHFKYPSSGRIAPWAFVPPHTNLVLPRTLTINNTDAGMRAALTGMGLAHLPVYVAERHVSKGDLVPVLGSFMKPFGSLSLVWPSNRQLLPKVRSFVDFIIENLSSRESAFRPLGLP